jgi:hypothetical protein
MVRVYQSESLLSSGLIVTDKKYTFTIKDELLPRSPNGREQSTISYEYAFQLSEKSSFISHSQAELLEKGQGTDFSGLTSILIPWSELKATYRGKEKRDAPALNTKDIKRFGIMMRRFEYS